MQIGHDMDRLIRALGTVISHLGLADTVNEVPIGGRSMRLVRPEGFASFVRELRAPMLKNVTIDVSLRHLAILDQLPQVGLRKVTVPGGLVMNQRNESVSLAEVAVVEDGGIDRKSTRLNS